MKEKLLLHHSSAQDGAQVVAVLLSGQTLRDFGQVQQDVKSPAILAEIRLVGPALLGRWVFRWCGAERGFDLPAVASSGTRWRQTRFLQRGNADLVIIALVCRNTSLSDAIW